MDRSTSLVLMLMLLLSLSTIGMMTPIRAEPRTHTIEIYNNYFSPDTLEINPNDTVVFVWTDNAQGHNVAQVDDADSASHSSGFRSGDPLNGPHQWQLAAQYTMEDAILYFICEPHVIDGMTGRIIVGQPAQEEDVSFPLSFALISLISTWKLSTIKRKNK